jgi:hypothetical protein
MIGKISGEQVVQLFVEKLADVPVETVLLLEGQLRGFFSGRHLALQEGLVRLNGLPHAPQFLGDLLRAWQLHLQTQRQELAVLYHIENM